MSGDTPRCALARRSTEVRRAMPEDTTRRVPTRCLHVAVSARLLGYATARGDRLGVQRRYWRAVERGACRQERVERALWPSDRYACGNGI